MKRLSKKSLILLLITVLLLLFIWGHSVESKAVSAEESGRVLQWITPFLENFVGTGNVTDHLVRKLAHFAEFAALGLVLLPLWRSFGAKRSFPLALVSGWLVGFIDESLQMFSDRGDQIIDVWLDVAGVVFGLLCIFLFGVLFRRKEKN